MAKGFQRACQMSEFGGSRYQFSTVFSSSLFASALIHKNGVLLLTSERDKTSV